MRKVSQSFVMDALAMGRRYQQASAALIGHTHGDIAMAIVVMKAGWFEWDESLLYSKSQIVYQRSFSMTGTRNAMMLTFIHYSYASLIPHSIHNNLKVSIHKR